MKVDIYEENEVKKEYRLKLFRYEERIVLALADEDGYRIEGSGLIAIKQDMTLIRCINIDESHDLPLDSDGYLMLGEDD